MQKEKSIGRNILIVFLIIVMIASVCAALFAWAKYQTTINGTATGETAKWSFKVSDGNTSTQDIDFPMTRTDSNTSVAEGKIAPGTYGKIEIGIDATGTETALIYVIEGEVENKPINLKFYSDEERTLELAVVDNKFSKGGYMNLNEIGEKTETIYWEWLFETGSTESIIEKNNERDTEDSGKIMSMQVNVTGKQLNGNPVLADLVQVGDYVNYNASSNGTYTFSNENCLAGSSIHAVDSDETSIISTDNNFDSSAKAQWRVLNVDRATGVIELMSVDSTNETVKLNGKDGYYNAETVLENIGSIYGHGKGAISGRSLNLQDIDRHSIYDKYKFVSGGSNTGYYGGSHTYESGSHIDDNGNIVVAGTGTSAITVYATAYSYVYERYCINRIVCDMLSYSEKVWLASKVTNVGSKYAYYSVSNIGNSEVGVSTLYQSNEYQVSRKFNVCPVVTLESNIKTIGQDANGVWQLDV